MCLEVCRELSVLVCRLSVRRHPTNTRYTTHRAFEFRHGKTTTLSKELVGHTANRRLSTKRNHVTDACRHPLGLLLAVRPLPSVRCQTLGKIRHVQFKCTRPLARRRSLAVCHVSDSQHTTNKSLLSALRQHSV